MYQIFIHPSVNRHLCCFYVLAIINSAAMNIGVHVPFWIMVFSRYRPRSGIAGSYDSSVFRFLRKLHIILHSSCTNLHSQQKWLSSLFSIPSPVIVIYRSLMMVILTNVKCYLIVVLIGISLIISIHWLNGHEFEQTQGDSGEQRSLVCCSPWGGKELDMTQRLNNNNN